MRRTVLGMHHVGRRLKVITRLSWDWVIVFGIRRHRKTMMSGSVQRSIVSLICGKLAGMLDGVLWLICWAIVGDGRAQSPRGREVVIFIWRAR